MTVHVTDVLACVLACYLFAIYGGFHQWGYPKRMVSNATSQSKMDDLGVPIFDENGNKSEIIRNYNPLKYHEYHNDNGLYSGNMMAIS